MRVWGVLAALAVAALVVVSRPRGALQPVSPESPPPPRTLPAQPSSEPEPLPSPATAPSETPIAPPEPVAVTSTDPTPVIENSPTPTETPTPPPPRHLVEARAGTPIQVILQEQLDTQNTTEEHHFSAYLAKDLKLGQYVVAPKGSPVAGVVRRVDPPGRAHGRARLDAELRRLQTPQGWVGLTTDVIKKEKSGAGKDGAMVGIGALAGALIGGLTDGRRGAARGAGAGAAVGAGATLSTRGPDVFLKAGSRLKFRLLLSVLFEVPTEAQRP